MSSQISFFQPINAFKNITNDPNKFCNQLITHRFHLANPVYDYNNKLFFYINFELTKGNVIYYETKDKLIKYELEIIFHYKTMVGDNEIYKEECRQKYITENILEPRIKRINDEINRVQMIEDKIKTEIIHNLNFTKPRQKSHCRNIKNKINGKNQYKKSLFLDELFLSNNSKTKIINFINNKLKITLRKDILNETMFIYFAICHILKTIELYKNYLSICLITINKDLYNLNEKFIFNDILENRICERDDEMDDELDKWFSKYYIFNDYYINAIDNTSKNMALGYILALSKDKNEWNVFPKNNNDVNGKKCNVNFMIEIIEAHEKEGIDLIENYLN
jgi:hypothetical protein